MTRYAGIDYSMTCPSIFVGNGREFRKGTSFFLNGKKKSSMQGQYGDNVIGMDLDKYTNEQERYDLISSWAVSVLAQTGVKEVIIEGYSMGSAGRVFHIAENTGLLKYKLWKAGIRWHEVPPTTAKKHFSGSGTAKKPEMHDAFLERTGLDIGKIFDQDTEKSPTSDTVDSYAIYLYGLDHFFGVPPMALAAKLAEQKSQKSIKNKKKREKKKADQKTSD